MTQIPVIYGEEGDNHCHHTSKQFPCITFTLEDMQVKGNMIGPSITRYIESSKVGCIQADPGSALSIIPRRVMQHLEIPTHRLSATQTIIYGFNANGPDGKN